MRCWSFWCHVIIRFHSVVVMITPTRTPTANECHIFTIACLACNRNFNVQAYDSPHACKAILLCGHATCGNKVGYKKANHKGECKLGYPCV